MSKLYVIRHSLVHVDPQVSPENWRLSEEGIVAAHKLALQEQLDGVECIWHSPEKKAKETAQIIADTHHLNMRAEPDLRELKADIGFLEKADFQKRVGDYLEGQADSDFEDYQESVSRITACINGMVKESGGNPAALVSHGRILSVFYAHLLGRHLRRKEWLSIGFPDLSVLNTESWTVERGFLSGN